VQLRGYYNPAYKHGASQFFSERRDYTGLLVERMRGVCCGTICMYDTKGLSTKKANVQMG